MKINSGIDEEPQKQTGPSDKWTLRVVRRLKVVYAKTLARGVSENGED
ncbi:hypothetical protein [Rhodoferax sp.]|nr:hypothetical protein [Rhodoferax sp.]